MARFVKPAHDVPSTKVAHVDEGVTHIFARMLQREGYEVRAALNAEAGVQAVDDSRPNAIILDLRMPLVDGVEFLRRLRAHDTHTPSWSSPALIPLDLGKRDLDLIQPRGRDRREVDRREVPGGRSDARSGTCARLASCGSRG